MWSVLPKELHCFRSLQRWGMIAKANHSNEVKIWRLKMSSFGPILYTFVETDMRPTETPLKYWTQCWVSVLSVRIHPCDRRYHWRRLHLKQWATWTESSFFHCCFFMFQPESWRNICGWPLLHWLTSSDQFDLLGTRCLQQADSQTQIKSCTQ